MNSLILRSAIVAALGGLLFGFDTAVISGAESQLRLLFDLNDKSYGFTVAIALIGTIFGAALVERPADRLGRRVTLFILAILYFVSAVGSAFPWDWYSFLGFRFIGGLAVGGASVVSPMYIAEISPARLRGRLVACAQLNIVLGILLAFLSNYAIVILCAKYGGEDDAWRWMFGVEAIPSAAFGLLLFLTPESPRWLVSQQRLAEARDVLMRLGTDTELDDTAANELAANELTVDEEIRRIGQSLAQSRGEQASRLFERRYMKPILLAIVIAVFNQLSGINAILYYAPTLFKSAGASPELAMFQPVIVGAVNLLFTILAMAVIDRFGRRNLMLVGSIGYIVSLSAVAAAFFVWKEPFPEVGSWCVLGAVLVFIASHAVGQGAVIWVFVSEIFPNQIRAKGVALGGMSLWVANAVVAGVFPEAVKRYGMEWIFTGFAVLMAVQLLWVIFMMPETRGVRLEDMEETVKQA